MDDVCSAGACALDPTSRWLVRPTTLTVQAGWDATSPADVELGLWCPASMSSITAIMPKVDDDNTPSWSSGGCTLTADQLITTGFDFDAIDQDVFDFQQIAARTHVSITEAHLRAGVRTGSIGTITSITFTLTRQ